MKLNSPNAANVKLSTATATLTEYVENLSFARLKSGSEN